ncbi:MAG: methyltransferase domain-containing protein [Mesorhizobium sp.]|uniref:methyltransferase domain-containing protein n=1 Tax=unclassified Mesorhizobium TaxID=325217 RepID=UPI000F75075E|nr:MULTISPECIES: methyltransferase domain-containing protein [unclassified Mesorhizobium]AZO38013.1 methyltransferase domain-containing protein [Mesorhizobium sp. M2A.F.Ca.ET.046.03.2.1]RWB48575.1 MAG: methyltransferase domain-containing protein [Mesorhizobium sp.]RWE19088.1 MAG: methyltransferase domain-containing protein [Mesorhizobium sp.]RWE90259.1 MAG: methyltransferase domain-containing protein [Mesorhizobium sp.]RWF30826.1 MAG: methyltransferase domain-containing protein [Mesorhizobium 
MLQSKFTSGLVCPTCYAELAAGPTTLTCKSCSTIYPIRQGIPFFVEPPARQGFDASFHEEVYAGTSTRARLYNSLKRLVTSEYSPHDTLNSFLASVPEHAMVIEFGSGARRIRSDVLNIDLFPAPNVDLVANIEHTPLSSNSVDYVILDSVIEHVPNPAAVVDEVLRVLRPGGKLLCINPFLFPYHGYPAHYCNFTKDGIEQLLRRFGSIEVQTHQGPTTAIVNILSEYVGVIVGRESRTRYMLAKGAVLTLTFPLKFIDKLLVDRPESHRIASMLSTIAIK